MVAHPSSNGGKSSTTEQTDNGIAYIRHDFGWWFAVLGWFVFALGHVQVFSIRWRCFGWAVYLPRVFHTAHHDPRFWGARRRPFR